MIKASETENGAAFEVRISPGASRTRIIGEHDGALKVSVSAAPEKGKANKALTEFLSSALGSKRASVAVISGETARTKRISVDGFTVAALETRLAELCGRDCD